MTQILLLGAGNYDDVALMMTLSSPFMMHAPGARPGTVLPEPYSFYWQKQQMAAFQLIRGKHAFFGTGWAVGLVHEWRSDLCELRLESKHTHTVLLLAVAAHSQLERAFRSLVRYSLAGALC